MVATLAAVSADREQAGRFPEAASAAGIRPAAFNLAGTVATGHGGSRE